MKDEKESLELARLLVDRAPDVVLWVSPDARLRYVNDAACEQLGFSRNELLTKSLHEIDAALDPDDWSTHWAQVRAAGSFTTETIYRARGGRRFPVEVTITPLRFRGEEHHLVFAREISERREAEDALIAITARLEGLLENLPIGILFEDDDRRVVVANQALCRMLDIPVPPAALSRADSRTLLEQSKELFPEPARFLADVESILQKRDFVRNEELVLADGRVYSRDYVPIVTQNYRAHLWQYHDVTVRKRAEREILRAKVEAEQANAAKSSFLAMMSHELRTPLNAILGMTELSLDTELSDDQKEFLRTIQTNSETLLCLIDDVLDLSKIEANRMDIELIRFDPRELVEEVAESLNVRAASKSVELVVDIDPHLPTEVLGDAQRIRQVLVNLVGNAVKFTERGFVLLSASVEDWKPGGRVALTLEVTDTGIGIPESKQRELFSKFYQADRSTTRRFGGTGLGLNISRSLVELMGGRIDFTSREGEGSRFRVSLAAPVPEDAVPNSARHRAMLAECPARVLLLVDTDSRLRALVRLLKSWGLEVESVSSFEEMKDRLATPTDRRTLVLVDHRPQTLDPARARDLRSPPHRELVLLTTIGTSSSAVLTEASPHQVVKPIRQRRLAETLARALGLRHTAVVEGAEAEWRIEPRLDHRVLLVEDNADNENLARRLLEGAGASVETAANGKEAVEKAAETLYDLVIMDLMMPVMDGLEATRRIREQEAESNRVPIVAMTAHATEGFRDRCLEAGMDDYLSKPFKKERFLALFDQWVDRRPIVLVVDDAPESRLIVKRFLMVGGNYRLLFATNGRTALDLFERHCVGLVLMDMEMPVLDGYEATRALRRLPGGAEAAVIAVTAHREPRELARCLEAGCTAVVQKPLDRKTLSSAVTKHLGLPREESSATRASELAAGTKASPSAPPSTSSVSGSVSRLDDRVVAVDPDIEDIVPRFLESQRLVAKRILELSEAGEFESIQRLGHNMKGTGKGYGFETISSYGASLERAAASSAAEEVSRLARELLSYLSEVRWHPRTGSSERFRRYPPA